MHTHALMSPTVLVQVKQRLGGGWQRFKGQRQKWFLVHFHGSDEEINLHTKEQEFGAWKW